MPAYIHSDRGAAFTSKEFLNYLCSRGIASSRTTPYNPAGNGQVERYNGIIWKNISLALKSRNLQPNQWETVLPDALHSIRSLLCTSINCTPHERIFTYQRKSTSGISVPSWLNKSDIVLLKKNVRRSKFDPLVEEVELLEVNPTYALIRHENGKESTVSIKHLAPRGDLKLLNTEIEQEIDPSNDLNVENNVQADSDTFEQADNSIEVAPELRRSTRLRNQPKYLSEYVKK